MSLTICLSGKSFQSTDNYIVQKLRLAAALYGVTVQLEFVDAKDSTMHLKIDGDNSPISSPSPVQSQQNSILRYILSLSSQVSGPESSLDRAQIDQWLEVSWNDIGISIFCSYLYLSQYNLRLQSFFQRYPCRHCCLFLLKRSFLRRRKVLYARNASKTLIVIFR